MIEKSGIVTARTSRPAAWFANGPFIVASFCPSHRSVLAACGCFRACLLVGALTRVAFAAEPPSFRVRGAVAERQWNARFAGLEGWIGGDAVYSAERGDRGVVWLFGDTLFGKVSEGRRAGAVMVNNSVGIMPRERQATPIAFASGKLPDGKRRAVFVPAEGQGWFWPQAAIFYDRRLFVFLAQIQKTEQPGVFGFEQIGQWLGVVENTADDPSAWRVEQRRLPFCEFGRQGERSWGSALLTHGEYVYVYGVDDRRKEPGSRRLLVARAPLEKLSHFEQWQFLAGSGWVSTPQEAAATLNGLATEFSVSPLPDRSGYVMVYTENGLGDQIVGRTSITPFGPWSAPTRLYKCPEMSRDRELFCYSAKAHAWAATGNELLISYCVNSWRFSRLFDDSTVYRPQFVRVAIEAPPLTP